MTEVDENRFNICKRLTWIKWLRLDRFFHFVFKRNAGWNMKLNKEKRHVLLCYISSRLLSILTLVGGEELKCNWIRRVISGQTLKLCVVLPPKFEGLCKYWYEEEPLLRCWLKRKNLNWYPGNQYQETVFFIFITVLFARRGASRLTHQCSLNISVRQHILLDKINMFCTRIKPWEFEILV
jgi:hypothetical protein